MATEPVLRSERLVGEPADDVHLGDLCRLFANPRVGRTLGGVRPPEVVAGILERWRHGWQRHGFGVWIFREADAGDFVGYGGLGVARAIAVAGEVELLYGLVPDAWGRGYASELAREAVAFGLRRRGLAALVGYTLATNRASRRVLEKCGFAYEREGSHGGLPHVFYRLEARRRAVPPVVTVRPLVPDDLSWMRGLLSRAFGSPRVVSRGRLHRCDEQPGLVALDRGAPAGLLTYEIRDAECEVVTLVSEAEGRGLGTALLAVVEDLASAGGCGRLWLVTTNDNTSAMTFYRRRGFRQVAVHRGAVDEARRLKPEVPTHAPDGTPIRDEIEFELRLT